MIKDSGDRTQFYDSEGKELAVRDLHSGKGRCDLMPILEVSELSKVYEYRKSCVGLLSDISVLTEIGEFLKTRDREHLFKSVVAFCEESGLSLYECVLEVSKHYEEGSEKYGERNWEKGIYTHSFLDSGLRHYLKNKIGMKDERHDRAFVWNMLGLAYTLRKHPDLDDIFYEVRDADS